MILIRRSDLPVGCRRFASRRASWYDLSMSTRKKSSAKKRVIKVVIGRERFAKISAVEGIEPSAAMRKRVAQFDRQRLSAAARRREIIKAYTKG